MIITFEETPSPSSSPPPEEQNQQQRFIFGEERPTPTKRPRLTRELFAENTHLDRSSPTNPTQAVDDQAENLQRLKVRMLQLENANKAAENRNKIIENNHKRSRLEYKEMIETLVVEKKNADAKTIYHFKRSQDASLALDLVKQENANMTERLQKTIDELESRNLRLSTDFFTEQRGREKATIELQTKQTEWIDRVNQLEQSVNLLQQQVEQQKAIIATGIEREAEVTQKWRECDIKLQELNNARFDTEAIAAFDLQIQLQDDTRRVEAENYRLKSDLKHYKEMCHNVEMLREENHSLESKVRDMDQLRAENMRLDILNTRLQAEKLEWAGYLEKEDGLGFETPQGLIYNLTKERQESRLAIDRVALLKSELKTRDKVIVELENHINELKQLNHDKDRTHRANIFAMELLEKDKLLLKEHVKILENQFKLYDVEETNYMEGNYDVQKTQRIEQLETLLKQFEDRLSMQAQDIIQSLMKSSDSTSISVPAGPYLQLTSGKSIFDFISKLSTEKEKHQKELESFQLKVGSQENAMDTLQERVQLLEDLIRRHEIGSTSPLPQSTDTNKHAESTTDKTTSDEQDNLHNTKILSLKENPESVAFLEQQLEKLRKENDMLLQPLLMLQQQSAVPEGDTMDTSTAVTIPHSTLTNLQYRIDQLEETVKQKDKRIMRYVQVFEKKVQHLYDIMTSIFGYQVSLNDTGMIRLVPNFVDGKDLHFSISLLKNDRTSVQILGRNKDEYAQTLQESYNTFVLEQNYIPGFLGYVTLDFKDRHTRIAAENITNEHAYLEQDPLTDAQGHELVHPEPIDQEDELDTDFVAEADDSGDNDYVMCVREEAVGYDGDRFDYLAAEDDGDTEDYEPQHQNNEIRHQEMTGEATYLANDDDEEDSQPGEYEEQGYYEENDDHRYADEEESGDELDESNQEDSSDEEESGDDENGSSPHGFGREDDPISLDDD